METISIVIISYNRPVETIEVLENVLFEVDDYEGFKKEIIVINNGSSEDYTDVVSYIDKHNTDNQIIYVNDGVNLGVSGGRNVGIKHSTGKYVVFIDDDAVFAEKDIIGKIDQRFTKDPSLGVIGFAVYNFYTNEPDHPVKKSKFMDQDEFYNNIFWGCGFVVPRSVFDELGNFEAAFFYGMEEYDLAYRVMDSGRKIWFTKKISVLHKVSTAGRERNVVKHSRMFVNKCILAHRYLPWYYVVTHFIMWSGFFLVKSRGSFITYFKSIGRLRKAMKTNTKAKLKKETLSYIRSVAGRLTY
ncbi:MAG: glycosyltransferase family 2 protein [Fluviicola sp.]